MKNSSGDRVMDADVSEVGQVEVLAAPPAAPVFPTRYLRFGAFELDLRREDLSKDGRRIRLQGKVYQTLLILLSRSGTVVTRDEVRRHLWPENLHVNFEANVNTTMNKLRQALGDSTDKPIYIETIPRRGYCFLPEVEFADSPRRMGEKVGDISPANEIGTIANAAEADANPTFALPMGLRIAVLVLAGMVVGALLVLAWLALGRNHAAGSSRLRLRQPQADSLPVAKS
jgi:DNA-binding winged helix-turn-helix (wHTH) protein